MAAMLMGAWSLQSCDNGPTKEVCYSEKCICANCKKMRRVEKE